jgi:predicted nucleotide-binding protein (sugar kinase/HSP70/actin superfamily)
MKALLQRLEVDYVIPPPNSLRTLSLGTKHSPEGACIPFKVTLGNMIESAQLGADTMFMPGGYGICRLGQYGETQRQIVSRMGYRMEILSPSLSRDKLRGLLRTFKRAANDAPWREILPAVYFGINKIRALDNIERLVQNVRAREKDKGTANEVYRNAIQAIDSAPSNFAVKRIAREYRRQLLAIPQNGNENPLVIGITGEFYVLLEPFINLDLESELGKLGVAVRRSTFLSEWMKFSFLLNAIGIDEKKDIHRAACPYLKQDIGGDGWESVGEKVLHASEYDGMIHLAPFTCMPEIIAANIMPKTREELPVLTIICDEQMGKAGMLTRLEAFIDLLERKRRQRRNNHRN